MKVQLYTQIIQKIKYPNIFFCQITANKKLPSSIATSETYIFFTITVVAEIQKYTMYQRRRYVRSQQATPYAFWNLTEPDCINTFTTNSHQYNLSYYVAVSSDCSSSNSAAIEEKNHISMKTRIRPFFISYDIY